ncbi:MAG: 2-haloacid dehalogenase [Acidimicrobiaceae bacterium]
MPVTTLDRVAVPPDVVAFDVIDTLFSLASLEPLLAGAGGGPSTLELWFRRLLGDGFALTAAGDYRSFSDVAKASLRSVLPDAHDHDLEAVVAGLAELDAHPDSAPAMGRAVEGARVVVLTNGSARSTHALLERGGLDAFVDTVVSVADAKAWKPAAAPYLHAAAVLDVAPERLAMATVHPWDVHGAHRAGLTTGWCNRDGRRYPATFHVADVHGPELVSVVEALLGLGVSGLGVSGSEVSG